MTNNNIFVNRRVFFVLSIVVSNIVDARITPSVSGEGGESASIIKSQEASIIKTHDSNIGDVSGNVIQPTGEFVLVSNEVAAESEEVAGIMDQQQQRTEQNIQNNSARQGKTPENAQKKTTT